VDHIWVLPSTSRRLILPRLPSPSTSMVDQVAAAIATANGAKCEDDPTRFRRLALAALKPMSRPTEAMIAAAYEAVRFDEHWDVNSRRDFRKDVRAMILAAMDGR
jgi:hypothetical protein